ncbi:MAG: hypothetical protein RLZZ440_3023 [Planctomycetota bacterium]
MRLTLRTLLAWIDDVLPPGERDELAAKVAESPVAPKLVERIREAIEDPHAAPPAGDSGPDDPNAVAEYLDNVLPVDQLEGFERRCLESPTHLAEVAACHRLLAEAARGAEQLAAPESESRRTLIRRVAAALAHEAVEPEAIDSEAAAAAVAIATAEQAPVAAIETRPIHEERASVWAWLAAAAAVALLVVLGGLLARAIWPAPRSPVGELAARNAHSAPEAVPADDAPAEPAAPLPAAPVSGNEVAAAPQAAIAPAAPPVAQPAVPPAAAVPLPEMAIAGEAASAQAAAGDDPEVEPTGEPAASEPAVARARVAAGDPLLRRMAAADARWQPSLAGEPLTDGDSLLAAAVSYPVIERGDLRIRLLPGTQAMLATDPDGTPRIEILFGRGVVWTDAAAGAAVGVAAGGLTGRVPLGTRQPLGIEVQLVHEPGDDPRLVPPGQRAMIYATGGVDWHQAGAGPPLAGIAATQPLPPRSSLGWTSSSADQAGLDLDQGEPRWLRQQKPDDRPSQAAGAAIAACLAKVPAGGSAVDAVQDLARDLRPEIRMAAASTLASLGDFDELVRLLAADTAANPLREGQWRALVADTIPLALGRGANAAARLEAAFLAHGPAGRGPELYRLACGFKPADLAAVGSEEVLAALDDPQLAVRRFAAVGLEQAVGDAESLARYRPDRAAGANQKGIAWWQARIKALAAGGAAGPDRP